MKKLLFTGLMSVTALTLMWGCGDDETSTSSQGGAGGNGTTVTTTVTSVTVTGTGGTTVTTTGTGGTGAGGPGGAGGAAVGGAGGAAVGGAGGAATGGAGGAATGGAGGAATGGAGGTGGTGGAGGMGPVPGDTCQTAILTSLSRGDSIQLMGDTTNATNSLTEQQCLQQSLGNEIVHTVTLQQPGSFRAVVRPAPGSTLNPTMVIRTINDCNQNPAAEFYCSSELTAIEGLAFELGVGTYHIIIDSAAGNAGEYELELSLGTPTCGDGILNFSLSEACDDGNFIAGDGCDPMCNFEAPIPTQDTCPGEAVSIIPNQQLVLQGSTVNSTDDFDWSPVGACMFTNPGGRDRVYAVTTPTAGTVTANIGISNNGSTPQCEITGPQSAGCWDRVLYVTDSCTPGATTPIDCSDMGLHSVETISFAAQAGQTYYIVVDGLSAVYTSAGSYNLNLSMVP